MGYNWRRLPKDGSTGHQPRIHRSKLSSWKVVVTQRVARNRLRRAILATFYLDTATLEVHLPRPVIKQLRSVGRQSGGELRYVNLPHSLILTNADNFAAYGL